MTVASDLHSPAVDAVLSATASLLGTEVVFIGGFDEQTFTFARVHGEANWPGICEGGTLPRTDAVCSAMLGGAPAATTDLPHDDSYAMPGGRAVGLGVTTYIGVPICRADGTLLGTLCGLDRGAVPVAEHTLTVLRQLAEVVATHLDQRIEQGVVIRRSAGGWQVDGDGLGPAGEGDLTSAMVLADLLADELDPQTRPARTDKPLEEIDRLRLSVTQLEHALAARVLVEQAIGVLAERQHHTPRESFERLRKASRARGRKVHDLAREVVLSATDHSVPLPPELAGQR